MPRLKDEKFQKKMEEVEDFTEGVISDKTFKIGQSYENEAATTLRCKLCKGTNFMVGMGSYYTAIKCTTCDWQQCIHNG